MKEEKKLHYVDDNDLPIEGEYIVSKPLMVFITNIGFYDFLRVEYGRYNFLDNKDGKNGFSHFLNGKLEKIVAWVYIDEYVDECKEYLSDKRTKILTGLKKSSLGE